MDSPNGKGSSIERRSSARRSRSLRLSTGSGVTGNDDYDLSAFMVADGFRPSDNAASSSSAPPISHSRPESRSQSSSEPPNPSTEPLQQLPPVALASSPEITPAMRIRPSSISKPPRAHDSLALRNDGTSTAGGSHARNVPSLSSDSPVIRAESPYTGPSGPSHPYQMYPQRTMSVATTSTAANAVIPEDRSYAGPRGPTHPYALYPQATTTSGESSETSSIPVGFNAAGAGYQRQLGPDGEEAGDLIGPLGHMEELPPYTRYPDNALVPKPATQTPSTEPSSPDRDIPGAGGIGMATRNPEFSSTDDDLALPRARPSVRSNTSENSHHDINTAAADVAEKPTVNKWQRRAKKKLWGIVPYWAICLLTVGLVVMGIIMGAVIGTLLSRRDGPPPPREDESVSPPTATTTQTATYDPEPLSTIPDDLPPVATGHYALPNVNPNTATQCLNTSAPRSAWTCEMVYSLFSITIQNASDSKTGEQGYELTLSAYNGTINGAYATFPFGTQPATNLEPIPLQLVNDASEPSYGPAWWLKRKFDKTFKKKPMNAKDGDKPWICTWPGTLMEIFIYPNQNATGTFKSSPTKSSDASAASSTSEYETSFDQALKPFPRGFKMVEKRVLFDEDQVTTCCQVEIVGNGQKYEKLYKDGKPITITIDETTEIVGSDDKTKRQLHEAVKRERAREMRKRATFEYDGCGCLWMSTS
ncbi:hypothetical protein ACJZ2D_002338 [Fusarium nematophilum]